MIECSFCTVESSALQVPTSFPPHGQRRTMARNVLRQSSKGPPLRESEVDYADAQ
jgi:hypothetical protein